MDPKQQVAMFEQMARNLRERAGLYGERAFEVQVCADDLEYTTRAVGTLLQNKFFHEQHEALLNALGQYAETIYKQFPPPHQA